MKPIHPGEAFFQVLRQIDCDLFLSTKEKGCSHCGGPLDTANYSRKTRGMTANENEVCFSLCCRREGCRKRKKPRSVRFFGRKVFGAWVVVLAVDFCQDLGLKGQIARQTIARWRTLWKEYLSEAHPFMRRLRSILPPGAVIMSSPASILGHFGFPDGDSLVRILKFISQTI